MPGSDDQYDQVHTYSQDHAGKSKTTKPAVREIGRDGAPVQLYVGEARDSGAIRTPPSGVGYIFFDQSDDTFKQIDSAGTVTSLAGGKSTEQVQDDVGTIMNEPLDYDDATPAVDVSLNTNRLAVSNGDLDVVDEGIQDIVGGMAGTNLTYDDANNVIDASGGGLTLTDHITTDAAYWFDHAQSIPIEGSFTQMSGSGSVTVDFDSVRLSTGTTDESHAAWQWQPWGSSTNLVAGSWDKDRTVAVGVQFGDTDGPLMVHTGDIAGEGNYTGDPTIGVRMTTAGDLIGVVADRTNSSTTTLIAGAAAGDRNIRMEYTAGVGVDFFIDGTNQGSITSNLPSGSFKADRIVKAQAENHTATDRSLRLGEIRAVQFA